MDEDEVNFYGTPFPPLEEHENVSKKPELDLTVRDWKGRRRFHGAFTGGFSAGYFNSVDTEKGWIPNQGFVSKRGKKLEKDAPHSKPEDFMDEEDFSVFGIAPKKVHTKDQFKGPDKEQFAGFRDPNASILDILKDIIKPSTQSIGVRLFRSMKRGKRYKGAILEDKIDSKRVYGCQMPPEIALSRGYSNMMDGDDDEPFDPRTLVLPYRPKCDFHGIGHKPLQSSILADTQRAAPLTAVLTGNKKLTISGEAFGYGALADEDDDPMIEESQIYSHDDMSKYDFEIGPPIKKQNLALTNKPGTSKFPHSQNLDGFLRSDVIRPFESDRKSLPQIPKGWRPHPPFHTNKKRSSRWDKLDTQPSSESIKPANLSSVQSSSLTNSLNANARAIILGEEVDIVTAYKKKTELIQTSDEKPLQPAEEDIDKLPKLSKPLTGFFANKFVRSDEVIVQNLTPGLSRVVPSTLQTESKKEEKKIESSVGLVKRETYQWHPHPLLCRRFEVPHPYPQYPDVVGLIAPTRKTTSIGGTDISITRPNAKLESNSFLLVPVPQTRQETKASFYIDVNPSKEKKEEVKLSRLEDREPLQLDLFKEIFANDEDSNEEDEEEDKEKEEKEGKNFNELDKKKVSLLKFETKLVDNVQKVDQDIQPPKESITEIEHFQHHEKQPETSSCLIKSEQMIDLTLDVNSCSNVDSNVFKEKDNYGPILPPDLPEVLNSDSEPPSKRFKKKKKSKHKKHKKTSKKKKKVSDSESEESEDSVDLKIIKLLREHRT